MVKRGEFFEDDEPVERVIKAFADGTPTVSVRSPNTTQGRNETLQVAKTPGRPRPGFELHGKVGMGGSIITV